MDDAGAVAQFELGIDFGFATGLIKSFDIDHLHDHRILQFFFSLTYFVDGVAGQFLRTYRTCLEHKNSRPIFSRVI